MDTKEKLSALRVAMKTTGVAAYIQPVHDEYMSEYPPASYRRVEWFCGFSGSAGMLVVTEKNAALFVDGRYTLQAASEVDAKPIEHHNSGEITPQEWLVKTIADGKIGYDPKLFTQSMVGRMQSVLEKKQLVLTPTSNLVDHIWKDKPPAPATTVFAHDIKYSGEASGAKRRRIGQAIAEAGAEVALINAPDSVCWLLNVRARDVENSPFLLAPMIVDTAGRVQLFATPSRTDKVMPHLGNEVMVSEPSMLLGELAALGKAGRRVLCDPSSLPVWFTQTLKDAGAKIVEGVDPCQLPKAMKNATELAGIKSAHLRDGLSVTKLLCWLDRETNMRTVTEMEVADKLLLLRKANEGFVEPSFNTIAGSGPHGAIVHYRATEKTNRTIKQNELFLLDSGGQYPDGTTDITRSVIIGTPSAEHKDRFTRVLKGHIAIATAQFPEGTSGSQLDSLARQYLWQAGLDYDHGTGHGVGHFLCVHEGPQRISKRGGDIPLKPGMILSNEPGYYKAGEYGIRIENLVAVIQKTAQDGKNFFAFETVTCAPIDTRLIDSTMLTKAEKTWLNDYHDWVLKQHLPKLSPEEAAWIKTLCAPV
jgi:Xaa-Pro aminopeptidase